MTNLARQEFDADKSYFGIGLYPLAEASKWIGTSVTKLDRLVFGYTRAGKFYEPLSPPELGFEGQKTLTFRDLIESYVISELLKTGLSVKALRDMSELLTDELGPYPFSSKKLRANGHTFFNRCEKNNNLREILQRHENFMDTIRQSLRDVDYDGDIPCLWWIDGRESPIVLDPHRSFGQPIINDARVSTAILHLSVVADIRNGVVSNERSTDQFIPTSIDFGVSVDIVEKAFEFESNRHAQSIYRS